MKGTLILLVGLLVCIHLMAQKKSCSCSFSSINLVGALASDKGTYFQFQSINGIRYKTWFAGVGTGVDMYTVSGIPLFFDFRKNIFSGKSTPFVYGDVGVHFAEMHKEETEWQRTDYSNSIYYDVGAGYRLGVFKKGGAVLSIGYSWKRVEKRYSYNTQNCNFYPCYFNNNRYTYGYSRFSIKAGWQF